MKTNSVIDGSFYGIPTLCQLDPHCWLICYTKSTIWCHYCKCNTELLTVEMHWRIHGFSKLSQEVWTKGKYQRTHFWADRAEPNWLLVTVAWRRTQLFHHHLANNHTQAGRDLCVCLPRCYMRTQLIISPLLFSLWASLSLSSSLSTRRTLPGSSPGLLHRRRLAS